jgi:cytochrome b involved in lipid metabolism
MDEIQARDRTEDWTVIFGTIYDIAEYIPLHPGGKSSILDAVAQDASKVFPRRPVGRLPEMCMNPNAELTTDVACNEFDEVDKLVNLHCHTNIVGFSGISRAFGKYERGILAHRPSNLKNDANTEWIMIYNRIYNVTSYIDGITNPTTRKIDKDSENAYLNEDLTSLIVNKRGEDATDVYEALYNDDTALSCLDDLFYIGVMDEPPDM